MNIVKTKTSPSKGKRPGVPEHSLQSILNCKRTQLIAVLVVWVFSSFLCSVFLFRSGNLYLDHLLLYSYFFDNLHSLNAFGEPAWWFPENQLGIPGYVYSLIGVINLGTPLFVVTGTVFWLLGLARIHVSAIQPIYVVYQFWLIPALFISGLWFCARQIFRNGAVVLFVVVIGAFSPVIMQNLKDPGLIELTAYGLYFAATYFHFLRHPARKSAFLALSLTLMILAVSAGQALMTWDLYFVPLVVLLPPVFDKRIRNLVWHAFTSIRSWKWAVLVLLLGACILPKLLVFSQNGDLVRVTAKEVQEYSFEDFRPGNPWQVLLCSVPGIGFGNTSETQYPNGFIVMPQAFFYHSSYLGTLALPLALFGLIFGRRLLRRCAMSFLIIVTMVIFLSANSPFFAPFLMVKSPFQSVNHFFDNYYGFGGCLALIFAAGLGVETVITKPTIRHWLSVLYAVTGIGAIVAVKLLLKDIPSSFLGFFVLLSVIIVILLIRLARARREQTVWRIVCALLLLSLLDIATVDWYYLKTNLLNMSQAHLDETLVGGVGLKSEAASRGANVSFQRKALRNLVFRKRLNLDTLPGLAIFGRAHISADTNQTDINRAARAYDLDHSLALEPDAAHMPGVDLLLRASLDIQQGSIQLQRRTYDSIRVAVVSSSPCLLFIRDAYSPFWKATVNGSDVPVMKALGYFKAVALPAGSNSIELRFRPGGIVTAMAAAYLIIIVTSGAVVAAALRERKT